MMIHVRWLVLFCQQRALPVLLLPRVRALDSFAQEGSQMAAPAQQAHTTG